MPSHYWIPFTIDVQLDTHSTTKYNLNSDSAAANIDKKVIDNANLKGLSL
jgi:hypothetical protein